MKINCKIKKIIDDDSIEIEVNGLNLLCFSNPGAKIQEGAIVEAELTFFDDIEIKEIEKENFGVKRGSDFFSHYIYGMLNVEKKCIVSVVDFALEEDDLYDYGYLDMKYVELFVPRMDVSFSVSSI